MYLSARATLLAFWILCIVCVKCPPKWENVKKALSPSGSFSSGKGKLKEEPFEADANVTKEGSVLTWTKPNSKSSVENHSGDGNKSHPHKSHKEEELSAGLKKSLSMEEPGKIKQKGLSIEDPGKIKQNTLSSEMRGKGKKNPGQSQGDPNDPLMGFRLTGDKLLSMMHHNETEDYNANTDWTYPTDGVYSQHGDWKYTNKLAENEDCGTFECLDRLQNSMYETYNPESARWKSSPFLYDLNAYNKLANQSKSYQADKTKK